MTDAITRLNAALEGRYRIESELGEGGMATVYLADDLKHGRKVALKVLKPELAAVVGAERFLAEIKTTANLQHPHILPLFDSGEADSFVFYVMPFVEGESLRDRLDREHQLPVDEAVKIATDLAEALDYAHRHDVIHRDIKPANILMHEGRPLIADFGIALAVGTAGGGRLTETGLSMGTPYYMSPEQATGEQFVGSSTDTYALGVVLYEMLIGDPPYMGSTAQAVLGQIIAGEAVSATKKRPSVPAHVDAALRCALQKLPADRFSSAQTFLSALGDEHFRYGELVAAGTVEVDAGPWKRLTMIFAATTVALVGIWAWSLLSPEPPAPVARFSAPFEEGQAPVGGMNLTADGAGVVYLRGDLQDGELWIRRWAELDAYPIRGTGNAVVFSVSPDGRDVAFSEGFPGPIRVVSLEGGPTRTLVETPSWGVWSWTADRDLFFTLSDSLGFPAGIGRIPVDLGGSDAIEVVTELRDGEIVHAALSSLPGGKMAVFQVWYAGDGSDAEIWAVDLETKERSLVTQGTTPKYASSGHLLWSTYDGTLMAAPIEASTAELTGPAVAMIEGLRVDPTFGGVDYSVAENGTLLYREGVARGSSQMVWMSRAGGLSPVDAGWLFNPGASFGFSLSPDGSQVAFTASSTGNSASTDVWLKDLPDGTPVRLTFDDQGEAGPSWSLDGRYVMYVKGDPQDKNIWRVLADGSGGPELVLDAERSLFSGDWSPDGEWLIARTWGTGQRDIIGFRPDLDQAVVPLVASAEFDEVVPSLSPDGRLLLYSSNETGQYEVYVRPFPIVDSPPVRVSTGGGVSPVWANSGRELFYVSQELNMIAVAVRADDQFTILQRETLFTLPLLTRISASVSSFDISSDDQQFLIVGPSALNSEGDRIILVQNFFEELKERAGN
jgi:eukaryotic-like serine/threonine-protein kinase